MNLVWVGIGLGIYALVVYLSSSQRKETKDGNTVKRG